jgi:hypothetical protein
MSNHWLQALIEDAIERRLCVRIGCTTCGAGEFRQKLSRALAENTGLPALRRLTPLTSASLASALAAVQPRPPEYTYDDVTRLILYTIWCDCGEQAAEQIWPLLGESYAAGVLQTMRRHYRALQQGIADNPILLAKQRAEKQRLKNEQIALRAIRKAERDAAWQGLRLPR